MAVERRQPLKVEVPSAKDESVRFGRVGLIVTVGFLVGIVWPRLAGVKLVPSAPVQAAEANSADLSGAPIDPKNQPVAPAASAQAPESAAEEPPSAAERLVVSEPQIVACRSGGKKKKEDCDQVAFDALARPHIQALSSCAGAEQASGVLSLGFELDFESAAVKSIKNGKSTSLAQDDVDRLLGCVKKEFSNVSLTGMAHKNDAYTIFYRVEFPEAQKPKGRPAEAAAEPAAGEVTEATGRATVSWDVALVRGTASRDGVVVARVMQGTRVTVTGRRGDWYRVKYDAKGSTGWVYRTAIGM
ncbi:MAG TPA: SH3 domain-containing protein [Polyangiaceae bacterium]